MVKYKKKKGQYILKKFDYSNDKLYHIKDLYNNYFNLINTIIIIIIILVIALIYTSKSNFEKELTTENEINITVDTSEKEAIIETYEKSYVYITGEVKNPGIYDLTENLRINDLIDLAGGLTDNANIININLAQKLYDEDHIIILSNEEVISLGVTAESSTTTVENTVVNINTANIEELKTINGVGDVTAENIIKYREENGKFENKEDIKNVTGIGEKTYLELESQIKVK